MNLSHRDTLANVLHRTAPPDGITTAQAAIIRVLIQGADTIPLADSRTPERPSEALAPPVRLSPETMSALERHMRERQFGKAVR